MTVIWPTTTSSPTRASSAGRSVRSARGRGVACPSCRLTMNPISPSVAGRSAWAVMSLRAAPVSAASLGSVHRLWPQSFRQANSFRRTSVRTSADFARSAWRHHPLPANPASWKKKQVPHRWVAKGVTVLASERTGQRGGPKKSGTVPTHRVRRSAVAGGLSTHGRVGLGGECISVRWACLSVTDRHQPGEEHPKQAALAVTLPHREAVNGLQVPLTF